MRCAGRLAVSACCCIFLFCGVTTYADTHWANLDGLKVPPYTSYTTGAHDIQDAIDVADKGDTVRVAASELPYLINAPIILADSVALIGAGIDSTHLLLGTIEETGMVEAMGYNLISDFDFNGARIDNRKAINISTSKRPSEISNCRFADFFWIIDASWADVEIHDCRFDCYYEGLDLCLYLHKSVHHNTFTGAGFRQMIWCWAESDIYQNVFNMEGAKSNAIGIYIDQSLGDVEVYNNLFLNGQLGIWTRRTDQTRIYNNTFVDVDGSQGGGAVNIGLYDYGYEAWVINNIFFDCDSLFLLAGDGYGVAALHFHYNLIWPPKDSLFEIGLDPDLDSVGNQFSHPLFANDTGFYLQLGSPCIDAGDPTILDVDGSRSDIGWTGGPSGIAYEYPQDPPSAPESLWAEEVSGEVILTWTSSPEVDLAGYRVFRNEIPGFWYPGLSPTGTTGISDTIWTDQPPQAGSDWYYIVTAVDTAGLESDTTASAQLFYTSVFEGEAEISLPKTPSITTNYPNPFNTSTTIEYYIPDVGARPTHVKLVIYDARGRKVAIIVDEPQYPGLHRTSWAGLSDDGQAASSGVYFARFSLWGHEFQQSIKIVLQK